MHLKLKEFSVVIGSESTEIPECSDTLYTATYEGADGKPVLREQRALALTSLLADPDQLPWLIARALQEMMRQDFQGKLGDPRS